MLLVKTMESSRDIPVDRTGKKYRFVLQILLYKILLYELGRRLNTRRYRLKFRGLLIIW